MLEVWGKGKLSVEAYMSAVRGDVMSVARQLL